jgi:hypothetical protein
MLRQLERLFLHLCSIEGVKVGGKVSHDIEDDKIVIDKHTDRKFTQVVGVRGRITIPIELREVLKDRTYQMLVRQDTKQLILISA